MNRAETGRRGEAAAARWYPVSYTHLDVYKRQTENLHIRSLVGRYLEHGRIYSFFDGTHTRIYIASGDFLTVSYTHLCKRTAASLRRRRSSSVMISRYSIS